MKKIAIISFSILVISFLIGGIIYFSSTTAKADDNVTVEMLNNAVSELQSKIDESNATIEELQNTVSTLQTTNESLNSEITSLKNRTSSVETKLTPLETEQSNLINLRNKYGNVGGSKLFEMCFYSNYSFDYCK